MENTILRGRYKITKLLGRGGFGETYLAEDGDRPGKPICVVKQLQVNSNSPSVLKAAQRLFNNEAEVLYKLGNHEQIPQLLAHFEENNQFFLVQEFIDGHDLSEEITPNRRWTEEQIRAFLKDVLTTLQFVHGQNVIHRDVKPSNLIRRRRDGKIFLIDFGVVKEIQLPATTQINNYSTISVGTPGYVPNEQLGGKPRFSSDIYALGITAIQALTKLYPEQIAENPQTGEILWRHQAQVSDRLAAILDKMVKSHFRDRYQSTEEVLAELQNTDCNSQVIVSNSAKSQLPINDTSLSQQLRISDSKSEVSTLQLISLPIIVGLIAATAVATLYLSRWFVPVQQVAKTNVAKVAPQVDSGSTPESIVVRPTTMPTLATSSNPTVVRSPTLPVSTTSPKVSVVPKSPTQPNILSPTITPKISPLVKPKALPPEQTTEPIPLTEVKCSTTSADTDNQSFVESLKNLTIGQTTVTAIAELASQNSNNPTNSQIKTGVPAGVDCLLNPRDATSNQFNTLKLAFGINDTNKYLSNVSAETKVRLTVYLDQKNIGSQDVIKGELKTWGVNIAKVQNVTLEAKCVKSGNVFKICPALVFTQVDLH